MLDFHTLAEFSRTNCVGICAFLVPANLIATLSIIIMTLLRRPLYQVQPVVVIASVFALAMVLHVYSWFVIGIVMAPTYILLSLAISCLLMNFGAMIFHKRFISNPGLSKSV